MDSTWQRCIDAFLDDIYSISQSKATVSHYSYILRHFFAGDKSPENYTREDVLQFLSRRLQQRHHKDLPVSTSTKNQRMAAISSFYRFAAGYTVTGPDGRPTPLFQGSNPIFGLRYGKRPYTYSAFTQEELDRFFAAIPADSVKGLRDRAIFLTYFWTARRREEIARLRWGDIDRGIIVDENGNRRQCWRYRFTSKGRSTEQQLAELPVPAKEAIDRYLSAAGRMATISANDAIFLPLASPRGGGSQSQHPEKHLSGNSIAVIFKTYAKAAGLDADRLHVHSFRHTSAQVRYAAGQDILSLKELLQHESLDTTYRYIRKLNGIADPTAQLLTAQYAHL